MMLTGDWARVQEIARSVSRRLCARDYPSWVEDVEQELLAKAAEVGPEAFLKLRIRWEAVAVIRAWFGRPGSYKLAAHDGQEDMDEFFNLADTGFTRHEAHIAWARMREAWPTLTPRQRAGLYCILMDVTPTECAAETGFQMQCIDAARRGALARIDQPTSYRKPAKDYRDATTKAREQLRARRARMKAAGIKRDRSKG